ncbi:MAG: uroporphyrinogen decarboxylase family protein [Anaerolineales bacterium]
MDKRFDPRISPDWEALVACIRRQGTPRRVHHIELFLDEEVKQWLCARYGLEDGLDPADPAFAWRREIAIQRLMGYDYVRASVELDPFVFHRTAVGDTATLARATGREYMDEHRGPITSWAEFEAYPWPDVSRATTHALEWYERNLPDDMCVIGSGNLAHFAEHLTWLTGYETLCLLLYDQRDLVQAIADRLVETYRQVLSLILQFDRVKLIWGSDDMGFNSGTLISPRDLRAFVLPGHRLMAQLSHQAGRPYLLHSCGNLTQIMPDLLDDVQIDAKHSYEDTIESVIDVKAHYGDRLTILGGIDVDFLCRASEEQVRARVRHTLDACLAGGGYVLGSGNSVTNYVPVANYFAMIDEGNRYTA